MMHSNAANLTGLFASASFCALINSACSFTLIFSYSASLSTSTKSTSGTLSRLCCLLDKELELPGRAALLALPSPGVPALRFLLGATPVRIGGDDSVKSTNEDERVVFRDLVGIATGDLGDGKSTNSSKGSGDSEPATRYSETDIVCRRAC
jgi:hypothetical protein